MSASGRHDEIEAVIRERYADVTDTISASGNPLQPADMPPDLLQDLARIETPFKGYDAG